VVLGSLSQAQSCLQKRLVSELPLTCGRTRAASDLRAAQPEHADCQQQRALSRTGGFVSSSKSCAFHGGTLSSETSDAMGAAAARGALARALAASYPSSSSSFMLQSVACLD
jgi:hypothetical protein